MSSKQISVRLDLELQEQLQTVQKLINESSPVPVNQADIMRMALKSFYENAMKEKTEK